MQLHGLCLNFQFHILKPDIVKTDEQHELFSRLTDKITNS